MKKTMIGFSVLVLVTTLGMALAQEAPKKEAPKETPKEAPTTKPAVNKFCAVNGEPEKVDPLVTILYKEKTIGFCCEPCIDEFKKDPEKYMKTLK